MPIFFPHYVQSKLFANVFLSFSCEFNMHVACTQNPNPCTTYMRTIKHEVHMPILIINIFIMGFTTIFPTIFFLFFNQNIGKFLKVFFFFPPYWKLLYFFPSKFAKIRQIFDIKKNPQEWEKSLDTINHQRVKISLELTWKKWTWIAMWYIENDW